MLPLKKLSKSATVNSSSRSSGRDSSSRPSGINGTRARSRLRRFIRMREAAVGVQQFSVVLLTVVIVSR